MSGKSFKKLRWLARAQEHDRQIVALAADFMTEIAAGSSTE